MSDAERSSGDSDSDGSGGSGRPRPMVGFLFGNVDSKMQLQDDYLDEVSR
jgi:TATA box-binding protein binding